VTTKAWTFLLALVAALVATPFRGLARPAHPNVVVFVADDLGWNDLGFTGSKYYESPNIDALAKRGCVFTRAYSACPVCSPTRAALLTGKYPQRVGITDYIGGPQPEAARKQPKYRERLLPAPYNEQLALNEVTIAEAFKEAGYATAFLGKWHLGHEKFYPDKQGFDATYGASFAGSPGKGGYFSPYKVPLAPGPEGEHLDLRLGADAAKWISQQKPDTPFLVYFCLYDVHVPLMAPEAAVKYFEEKRAKLGLKDEFSKEGASSLRTAQSHAVYAAMIKTMDDAVGEVVRQLESQKLLDDTIIVFTSDNGGLATAEGSPTSNLPLRGGKGWAYEGGVRVPLVYVVPGITRAGSKSDVKTISTDLFPTLLAACGLAPRPKDHLDGLNLLPAVKGEAVPSRPLFWHYPHYGNQGGSPFSSVQNGEWKLIAFHDPRQGVELYNLANDPTEKHNLAAQEPDHVKELRDMLDKWKKEVGAKGATPHDDRAALPGSSRIILKPTKQFPRYSEGDVIELADGRLLLACGRKGGASDFANGVIVGMFSRDGGETWDDEPHVIRDVFADRTDVMSASLFRTSRGIHLLFLARGHDAKGDTQVYQVVSSDEGKTWSEPTRVSQRSGYHVVNNARVARTSRGRLLVPASYAQRIDNREMTRSVIVLYSDDEGRTWHEAKPLVLEGVALMEPGIAQCSDGSLYMTIRTALGVLYEARSRDGGVTWEDLGPTNLPAPAAPSTVLREPGGYYLWLFWCNNVKAGWKQRTPQVFATSRDDGRTWSAPVEIENDPKHSYGYISFTPVKGNALLTYYDWRDEGQPSFHMTALRQRTIPLAWLH
jgi:arylsulfatase A-like enzyme